MRFGVLLLGLFVVFCAFGLGSGLSLNCVFVSLALPTPPAQCRARVWVVIGSQFEAEVVVFSCSFEFRPAYALLRPEPAGDQSTLSTHTVVRDCLLPVSVCVVFVVHFRLEYFPLAGL